MYLNRELTDRHCGLLRLMKEQEVRRLIIKLLIMRVLEEIFVKQNRGQASGVIVYIGLGKYARKLQEGRMQVHLSHGVDKSVDEFGFEDEKEDQV